MDAKQALRSGWTPQEEDLLFGLVERGRQQGAPLKAVFEEVAAATGRKPNSIRNYYYTRIKEDVGRAAHAGQNMAFVPFAPDEIRQLLRTVLAEQARGVSVRACTLSMGNGDNKAMLRYQNKYRSLIKNNPALVREVIQELTQEGIPAFDPYEPVLRSRRPGRPKKGDQSLVEAISGVVNDLDRVAGLDVTAFFESLGALAVAAVRGAEAMRRAKATGNDDVVAMQEENDQLRQTLRANAQQLEAQRERFSQLLSLFRQLMSVNRDFLGRNSVVKVSSLSDYIRELSKNMENCERIMVEYVN